VRGGGAAEKDSAGTCHCHTDAVVLLCKVNHHDERQAMTMTTNPATSEDHSTLAAVKAAAFKHREACREAAEEANNACWLDDHETPEDWQRDLTRALVARAARNSAEDICEAIIAAACSNA